MVIRIWIVVERALRRAFFRPGLQGRKFLERRQVIAATGCHQLLDRCRLRQVHQQALCGFLVPGEIPRGPEVGQEWRKSAFRSGREAMGPALLRNLRGIAPAGYISCTSMLAYFFIKSMREQGPLIWLPMQAGTPSHLPSSWPRYLTVPLTSPFCLISGSMMSLTGSSRSELACGHQVGI